MGPALSGPRPRQSAAPENGHAIAENALDADVDLVGVVAAELLGVVDDGVHDGAGEGPPAEAEFLDGNRLHRGENGSLFGGGEVVGEHLGGGVGAGEEGRHHDAREAARDLQLVREEGLGRVRLHPDLQGGVGADVVGEVEDGRRAHLSCRRRVHRPPFYPPPVPLQAHSWNMCSLLGAAHGK